MSQYLKCKGEQKSSYFNCWVSLLSLQGQKNIFFVLSLRSPNEIAYALPPLRSTLPTSLAAQPVSLAALPTSLSTS